MFTVHVPSYEGTCIRIKKGKISKYIQKLYIWKEKVKSMKVIKRDGKEVDYDKQRIYNAINGANKEALDKDKLLPSQVVVIEEKVRGVLEKFEHAPSVEEIQDLVIHEIMKQQAYAVAQLYTEYRFKQALKRVKNTTDDSILSIIACENEDITQENSNKNSVIESTQRDYIAGEVSKDLTFRVLLPPEIGDAHEKGLIHFHDSDYFLQTIHNCSLINLEDILTNGTVISEKMITSPKGFWTACNIATQVIAQVASNQYGGQSFSLAALVPFVGVTRKKFRKQVRKEGKLIGITYTEEQINAIAEERLKSEIKSGIQTIQYQLLTLMTTNGQTPFVSMYMDINEVPEDQKADMAMLIEEVLNQRIKGIQNEKGIWITPAFPKLLYVLDENNIREGAPFFYLTQLAAKCSAKRLVPDYISAKVMRELKGGDTYPCMGCRSFLTPDRVSAVKGNIANAGNYKPGEHKYYGRFNQGVVTINLVDVACSSGKDMDSFWKILDERLELCHKALRLRHERLLGTKTDVAPILWQHGALARLPQGAVIDPLLYDGYSTLSLGYAGLYEMCKHMTGVSHTDEKGKPFALAVMQKLNDKCNEWKEAENIDYSLYGTPLESTTYKFAKCLQSRFGKIEGVTDHNYITNSYHVNVREEIDAFTKLSFEAEFQKLSPGGAISYVEIPNMQHNLPAVIAIIQHIYENIMYAELNTKSDYCQVCGYEGEIQIVEDDNGKLVWECPQCKNRDQSKMDVARRTCGYIGTQFWNQGRTQEIRDRVIHVS